MEQLKKAFYVFLVQLSSFIFRKKKVKRTIVYLMSFPRNGTLLIKEMLEKQENYEFIIIYAHNCQLEAEKYQKQGVKIYPITQTFKFIFTTIPKIISAKIVICDNYFPFFAGIKKNKKTTIIQIWHANGAIKCFGWEDHDTKNRTLMDKMRFTKVYNSFDEYIVGSDIMGEVFKRSYATESHKIKKIGYPRSDIYFDKVSVERKRNRFYKQYPELKNKRIILYAPTYRDLKNETYPLDIERLKENFGKDSVLLMKQHPHIINSLKEEYTSDFFYHQFREFKIEDLLAVTDCLITDYSSIPFDFTLLDNAKKIIFYWFDYKKYENTIGLQTDFKNLAPGKIAYTMDDLVTALAEEDNKDFTKFNDNYNKYNDGKATKRFIDHINRLLNT